MLWRKSEGMTRARSRSLAIGKLRLKYAGAGTGFRLTSNLLVDLGFASAA